MSKKKRFARITAAMLTIALIAAMPLSVIEVAAVDNTTPVVFTDEPNEPEEPIEPEDPDEPEEPTEYSWKSIYDDSEFESSHPVTDSNVRNWEYMSKDYSSLKLTFSEDTAVGENDTITVGGRDYHGTELAGKTICVPYGSVVIKLDVNSENAYGFKVNVEDGTVYAQNVSELKASKDSDTGARTWNYTVADAEYLRVTFSENTDLGYAAELSVNESWYYGSNLAGKSIIVEGNSLSLRLSVYSSDEDYNFEVAQVTPVKGVTVTDVSELKTAHPVSDEDKAKIWSYTLPASGEDDYVEATAITFSEDTKLSGNDYISVNGENYYGDELAGETITVSGNQVKIYLSVDSADSYGFEVTKVEKGDPEELYEYKKVSNDFLYAMLYDSGNFSLGTTGGDPDNPSDDNEIITYSGTSFSTASIDGKCTSLRGKVKKKTADGTVSLTQTIGDIKVEQQLALVKNTSTDQDDVVKFTYTYTNNGTTPHKVGNRIMIDTMLGDNDDAPFRVPGTGDVTTSTTYEGANIPQYWQAFDSLTDPTVIAQGSFTRDANIIPDKVMFTNWNAATSIWNVNYTEGEPNGDSAVVIFWNERELAPGESITFTTYYGLSQLVQNSSTPLVLSAYGDKYAAQIDYDEATGLPTYNQPTYTAYINNTNSEAYKNVELRIQLPNGISLAEGQNAVQTFDTLEPGAIQQAAWNLVFDPTVVEAGKAYDITIWSKADNDEEKSVTTSIRIPGTLVSKTDINNENITLALAQDTYPYTGEEVKPDFTLKNGDDELIEGANYTVAYTDNINAGTVTATITGTGMYKGTRTFTYTIAPKEFSELDTTLSAAELIYSGSEQTPDVTVKDGEKTLVKNTDYTVSYAENINAGTATVTVTSINPNYAGTKTVEFEIKAKAIDNFESALSYESVVYDGTEKTPEITLKDGDKTLVKDTDYTVAYDKNTNAGTATVTITGKGNYQGTVTKEFVIEPKDISTLTATLSDISYTYDGTAKTPTVTVKDGEKTLAEGTDFKVSYGKNVDAGTVEVIVEGVRNYKNTIISKFAIAPKNIDSLKPTLSSVTYTYNGTAKTPDVTVKDGDKVLVKDTDYTVAYDKNTNAGTATVTITGIGNYTGKASASFTITGKSIKTAVISGVNSSYVYTGTAKTPAVTVKDGTKTLKKGTDYTVSYKNNIKAGTATITIKGEGNYSNTVTKTFKIIAKAISKAKLSGIKTSYKYTGKNQTPSVTLKDGKTTLKKGTDYTVTYKSNKAIGKATITIKGKGNYSGAVTKTFQIVPKTVTIKSASSPKTKQLKATWKTDSSVTGYQIAYATNKNFKSAKTTLVTKKATSSKTISDLTKGKTYYVKVRAYKTVNGKKVYGAYSSVKTVKVK